MSAVAAGCALGGLFAEAIDVAMILNAQRAVTTGYGEKRMETTA
jgi:hypothetical protein